ncbi:MAG TPA: hypothetical protein VGQ03_01865 [Nitrososphaera sp.]|jgi:plastocyanin|nr:hypothetical protein [Nitrososphaera sp.]
MMRSSTTKLTIVAALFAILSGTVLVSGNASSALESAAAQESEEMTPLSLKTDNDSVNVIISWDPQEIEPGQEVTFTVNYRDASSGQPLAHVNHDFKVTDESGQVIESATGLHTHSGGDIHTVTFDQPGNFELEVTIHGLGINQPFDTTRSGAVQTAIVVVPEFPVAPLILAAATGLALVSVRLKVWKFG